jgi:hypothetical protein
MRKFLWVVAVGALVLAVAAPAMAVDVKFGAEYRVRFYDYANLGFNSVAGTNPRGVQLRFRPLFTASDDNGNIVATWRGEFGDTQFGGGGGANGQNLGVTATGGTASSYTVVSGSGRTSSGGGGGAGADGVALETKWAFMDFALPFGVPLRVRAGIQAWYLPKGLVTDDDYAGVKAYGSVAPVNYEFGWWRANRGTNTTVTPSTGGVILQNFSATKDNAFDYYHVKFDAAFGKLLNPYLYYVYGDNRSNCSGNSYGTFAVTAGTVDTTLAQCLNNNRVRPQHFVGLGFTGDAGTFSYDLDWVWGTAEGGIQGTMYSAADGKPIQVQGWVLDGGVHIPIGPVTLNLVGSLATGDKQDTSGHKSNAFPGGPGTSWSGPSRPAGGPYEIIGEGGDFDVVSVNHVPTGLWTIGTSAEYLPVKALTLRVHYLYIGFVEKYGNCAYAKAGAIGCFGTYFYGKDNALAGKSTLGQEIGLKAVYTMWTGFKVQAFAGWLVPTKGDTTGKYILQMLYNF